MIRSRFNGKEPGWYAVYTRSRAEKKLYTLLEQKKVECFLPLKKSLKQRSDRKVWVQEPLLPSYIFVRVTEKEFFWVLNTPGAVCYVSFEGRPVSIPEEQIKALHNFMAHKEVQPEVHYGSFEKGDLVEVSSGTLKGLKGEVVKVQGRQRLILRFDSLGYCVHFDCSRVEFKSILTKEIT